MSDTPNNKNGNTFSLANASEGSLNSSTEDYATTTALGEEGDIDNNYDSVPGYAGIDYPVDSIKPTTTVTHPINDDTTTVSHPVGDHTNYPGIEHPGTGTDGRTNYPGIEHPVKLDKPTTDGPQVIDAATTGNSTIFFYDDGTTKTITHPLGGDNQTNYPGIEHPGSGDIADEPIFTTQAGGEEGDISDEPIFTTHAFGEEGEVGPITMNIGEDGESDNVTDAKLKEDIATPITLNIGEDGENDNPYASTNALGKEGEINDAPICGPVPELYEELDVDNKPVLNGNDEQTNYPGIEHPGSNGDFTNELPIYDGGFTNELPIYDGGFTNELPIHDGDDRTNYPGIEHPDVNAPSEDDIVIYDMFTEDMINGHTNMPPSDSNITIHDMFTEDMINGENGNIEIHDVLDMDLVNGLDTLIAAISESAETFSQPPKAVESSRGGALDSFSDIADMAEVTLHDII